MKKHTLHKVRLYSPVIAVLGGRHYTDTMPAIYSRPYNHNLNAPRPKSTQVVTRIRLSEGKPKKFFK
ncbi:MAG: hypothetical protein K2J20_06205 [Bacilli bacterium]|nr:hypothetical protein [Bacilli bacterium]